MHSVPRISSGPAASQSFPALKFGYLVPEFPGQTHTFFWREIAALRGLGMDPDLISTRRPASQLMPHTWTDQAESETTYLAPVSLPALFGALAVLAAAAAAGRVGKICTEYIKDLRSINWRSHPRDSFGKAVRGLGLIMAGAELAHLSTERGWRHIHVHSCADSAQVALTAHRLTGLTYSLTLHGPLGDYGDSQSVKWANAAFSTVITDALLMEVRSKLGLAAAAGAEVVPMGVDVTSFSRERPYVAWNGHGPVRIYSCGRLNSSKGHDDLMRATGKLVAAGFDIELVIAGEDEQGGGGYRRTLESLVLELGIRDHVSLPGSVSEDRVRSGLEEAHIFVLASHAEPLGVAIMEAMSMELPLVATDRGGVAELVEHGISGILVEPTNPSALYDGIVGILSDPVLAARLGRSGRERIIGSFTSQQGAAALARRVRHQTVTSGPAIPEAIQ